MILDTYKTLVLSKSHMPKALASAMATDDPALHAQLIPWERTSCGYRIWLGSPNSLPAEIKPAADFAAENGCVWIEFDVDGRQVSALPKFDLISEVTQPQEPTMPAAPTHTPHVHAEFIKAWADGAEIQWRRNPTPWRDCVNNAPGWDISNEYRIKPERKPNVVTWHGVNTWTVDASCMDRSDINAADGQIVAILRVEIDHNDPANPVLVSATLEKP